MLPPPTADGKLPRWSPFLPGMAMFWGRVAQNVAAKRRNAKPKAKQHNLARAAKINYANIYIFILDVSIPVNSFNDKKMKTILLLP